MSEPPLSRAEQARVLIPFALVTIIWGSTWLVIRDQLGVVPPSWSVAYRFAAASGAMFLAALVTRTPLRMRTSDQVFAALVGIAQFAINFNFVYRAEAHITSGLVALVFALLIIPNALFARIFLGQGVSRPFLCGSAVAIVGLALLFAHELQAAPAGASSVATGIMLTLGGVLAASAANVMQASDRARALPMTSMLAWAMAWGALANALYAGATAGGPVIDLRWGYVVGVLYLAIFGSAVAFALYFGVIRRIGPGRAAYSGVLVPVIAMALSTLFEGYRWAWESAAGAALALLGLVIALSARSPVRKSG